MSSLPHRLDRSVVIHARRDLVFRFLTETPRWAAWWGAGSTIDPRPGGRLLIRYPNAVEAAGEVLEVARDRQIVFTYGFVSGTPIAPGASRVTIRLEDVPRGTRVHLTHEFAEAGVRDDFIQGWRYQLSLFGNVVADEAYANAGDRVDAWFAVWAEPDADARHRTLATIAADAVDVHDRFTNVDGLADLEPHIAAFQRFMPGMRMRRTGETRQCQGMVLADWVAAAADGHPRLRGTSVFTLGSDGRIDSVTGFVAPVAVADTAREA